MNFSKELLIELGFWSIILGGCIYGLYDIITKITKLYKENKKKNTGKIFGLVIALLLVLIISVLIVIIPYKFHKSAKN